MLSDDEKRQIEHEEMVKALEEQSTLVHSRMMQRVRHEQGAYRDWRPDLYNIVRIFRKIINTMRGVLLGDKHG